MKRKLIIHLICALMAFCAAGQANAADRVSRTGLLLDTAVTITLYGTSDEAPLDRAFEMCAEYEALFSRTREGSDIYRINNANGAPVNVDPSTAELLNTALDYAALSGGAFDPSVEPLITLWNITSENPRVPEPADIVAACARVDWTGVSIEDGCVRIRPGMGLDLGAIAKGYIADRLGDYLAQCDISGAIINLGGNVMTVGAKPDGSVFTVGVRKPFGENGEIIGAVRLSDMSVVTSGIYERYFEEDGILYHHIMDPYTGYPVNDDVYSVTIVSPHSVDGDALSTLCFVLGVNGGIDLVDGMEGVYAIYCMADGTLRFSDGAEALWIYPDEL